MAIQFVQRDDIDKVKWNSCVHYAPNGNVFGYLWYLDQVARQWDGLVEDDYTAVMPLVWRKGLWRKELYAPPLLRELGIYSQRPLTPARIKHFLEAIPPEFRQIDMQVGEDHYPAADAGFKLTANTNYVMSLLTPYETLRSRYSPAMEAELAQAEAADLRMSTSLKPEQVADFYRRYMPLRQGVDRQFHALQRIMYNALHRGWGFASGVMDSAGTLLATDFFIISHSRVMSLAPSVSRAGQDQGALALLFDTLIRSHAGRPMALDFNWWQIQEPLPAELGALSYSYYRIQEDRRWMGIL